VSSLIGFLKGKSAYAFGGAKLDAIARSLRVNSAISTVRISGHGAMPFRRLALN
jgi:hypothetical protein